MPREPNATSLIDEAPDFTRQRAGGTFMVIKGPDRGEHLLPLGGALREIAHQAEASLPLSASTINAS